MCASTYNPVPSAGKELIDIELTYLDSIGVNHPRLRNNIILATKEFPPKVRWCVLTSAKARHASHAFCHLVTNPASCLYATFISPVQPDIAVGIGGTAYEGYVRVVLIR